MLLPEPGPERRAEPGSGTVDVNINGHATQTVTVSGIPRLYTVYQTSPTLGHLVLHFSPGVQAYDFTFG